MATRDALREEGIEAWAGCGVFLMRDAALPLSTSRRFGAARIRPTRKDALITRSGSVAQQAVAEEYAEELPRVLFPGAITPKSPGGHVAGEAHLVGDGCVSCAFLRPGCGWWRAPRRPATGRAPRLARRTGSHPLAWPARAASVGGAGARLPLHHQRAFISGGTGSSAGRAMRVSKLVPDLRCARRTLGPSARSGKAVKCR